MADIGPSINQLANSISNTPEFINYKNLRRQVGQDNNLSTLLSQFEARKNQFYTSQYPPDKAQQIMNDLNNEYTNLNTFPLLNQYFAAEEQFNRFFAQSVIQSLNLALEQRL